MLLANLTLRHHSIWDDDCHKMASLLKDETFQTYNNWCDKMGVAGDRRFLKIARASQLQATRKNWDAGPEHGGLSDADRLECVAGLRADRRELLVTTLLEARPQSVLIMPNPSIWPFLLSLAVGFGFLGFMFEPWLFVVGFALSFFMIVGWLWPKKPWLDSEQSYDQSHDQS